MDINSTCLAGVNKKKTQNELDRKHHILQQQWQLVFTNLKLCFALLYNGVSLLLCRILAWTV